MFTENMIAPCGLDCSLCRAAHKQENPCEGCLGDESKKSHYCATCGIAFCENLRPKARRFCTACMNYPCREIVALEERYANMYPLVESPMGNLAVVRDKGAEALCERQRQRWTCPECGGVICVHTGKCAGCGREFTANGVK